MKARKLWTIQSFLSCYIWNGVLIAFFFILSLQMIQGCQQWVYSLMAASDATVPENIRAGLLELQKLLNETEKFLAPVVLGSGALFTTVLWLFLLLQGRGLARRVAIESAPEEDTTVSEAQPPEAQKLKIEKPLPVSVIQEAPTPQAAIQILSILQREGRLIDFLQEDLSAYDDAQIGAAVRSIHEGCKQGLAGHMELKPVFDEEEGSRVTVPANFDPHAIRLTGNVTGEPPFTGSLRHRGWQTVKVDLPVTPKKDKDQWIIAPAEVEIGD